MDVESGSPAEAISNRKAHWAAAGLIIVIAFVVMDGVAAAVLLPRIAGHFNLQPVTTTWIVNAYQLVMIAAILPFAALAQIIGYRRVYLSGLCVFILMGLVSAMTPDFLLLIAARTIQGLAAACIASVNLALIRVIMPPEQLGKAIGFNAMSTALATTIGPTVAGLVLSVASWNWMFALTALLLVPPAILGFLVLPATERLKRRFDWLGAVLSAVTFAPLIMALNGVAHGWPPVVAGALCLLSLAAGILLVRHVRGDTAPILPIDLLRIPLFRLSLIVSSCSFATQMLIFVSLPFYLQSGLKLDPLQSGLIFSAWPFALAVMAPIAGILADKVAPGLMGLIGLGIMALGITGLLLLSLTATESGVMIMACLALCGAGFALFQTPNNRTIMTSAPSVRGSAASGALSTARLFGQALGTSTAALSLAFMPTVQSGWTLATALAISLCVVGAITSSRRGFR